MTKARVFIIWDFELHSIRPTLEGLAAHPPEGYEVFVPGVSEEVPTGRVFEDRVRKRLDASDRVLVLTDLPNANVGFELGYALGRGKPVILASIQTKLPDWVAEARLFGGWFVASARGSKKLRQLVTARLEGDEAGKEIAAPQMEKAGEETLFLCARSEAAEVYLDTAERVVPSWLTLGEAWPTWEQLPERLSSAGRVVRTIAPVHTDEPRDGIENALASVVAGLAKATDRELIVLRDKQACPRGIIDVKVGEYLVEGLKGYEGKLRSLSAPAPTETPALDPVTVYRAWLGRKHSIFVPFFETQERAFEEVCVTLKIQTALAQREPENPGRSLGNEALHRPLSLAELLSMDPDPEQGISGHWSVLGEPGSGKSTACRLLCKEISKSETGALPVLLSLTAWVRRANMQDPFDYAQALAQGESEDIESSQSLAGLAEALRKAAKNDGAVWLLFDGLDELTTDERSRLSEDLPKLIARYGNCRFLVTSRPTDFEAPASVLCEAQLSPLKQTDQDELLERWIGPDLAEGMRKELQVRPRLAELAPNPLMLTFLAKLYEDSRTGEEGEPLPSGRSSLYGSAVRLLLERGRAKEGRSVRSPEVALRVLPELALTLLESERDAWSRSELFTLLNEVLDREPSLEKHLSRAQWIPEDFLEDIRSIAGLLGDHDGPGTDWRFLHRSLGEYLAAVALAEQEEWAVDPVQRLRGDEARWGETFALLTGLLPPDDDRRQGLLNELVASDADLAKRTLPQIECLAPREAVELLKRVDGWDGDDLRHLVMTLVLERRDEEEIRDAVLEDLSAELSAEEQAWRLYALQSCGLQVDPTGFFKACGRSLSKRSSIEFTPIPAGEFLMGSEAGEEGRYHWEHDLHHVSVPAFHLAPTPVTQGQYAAFDSKREVKDPRLPAVDVNWWEAWLFCRWIGARLPSEAEWEYACRGRTRLEDARSRYSSGDSEEDLARVGWYSGNSDKRLHRVGKKAANDFGLFDMHGNVFEWCQDSWAEDNEQAYSAHPAAYEPILPGSSLRVGRGGGFASGASFARSAYRVRFRPSRRWNVQGFRPARSTSE